MPLATVGNVLRLPAELVLTQLPQVIQLVSTAL
jgi:hypothetical protein